MLSLLNLVTLLAATVIVFSSSLPLKKGSDEVSTCDELFVEYNYTNSDNKYYPYYISFTLKATTDSDFGTYITVKNVKFVSDHKVNVMCSKVEGNITVFEDFTTKDFTFFVGNASFDLYVDVEGTAPFIYPTSIIISAIADQGSFSMVNGEMFDNSKSCSNSLGTDSQGKDYGQQCCKSFKPASGTSTTGLSPCTDFSSLTTIYQTNNSYSIFGTTKINYQVANNQLSMSAVVHQEGQNFQVIFHLNGNSLGYRSDDYPLNATFDIPKSSNSKFILTISDDFGRHIANLFLPIGRFTFLQNGVALIEDSTPFTPKNNCQYFPNTIIPYQSNVATTQICCTKFS